MVNSAKEAAFKNGDSQMMAADGEIATLSPVDVRDVWAGEATHFTPWLAKHADLLGAALGLDLDLEKSEAAVGRFSADLVFRDTATDRAVVVENMFGPTDHDHLGKLITYAAGLEAGYAVLLATQFGDEHRSALNWLNHISTDNFAFFGVVLEAWRIGDSPPAPRRTPGRALVRTPAPAPPGRTGRPGRPWWR